MICTRCGTQNPKGSKFCLECGKKLLIEAVEMDVLTADQTEADDVTVAEALHEALKCYERGRIELAFVKCRNVLRMRPESTSAHSLLALIYEKKASAQLAAGARDDAEDYLHAAIRQTERVIEANPESEADREKLEELIQKLEGLAGRGWSEGPGILVAFTDLLKRIPTPVVAGVGSFIIVFAVMSFIFMRGRGDQSVKKDTRTQVAQSTAEVAPPMNQAPQVIRTPSSGAPAWSYTPPAAQNNSTQQQNQQSATAARTPQQVPQPVNPLPQVPPYPVQPPSPPPAKTVPAPAPAPAPAPKDPLDAARTAHRNKDYAAAAKLYEQVIASGQDSGEIEEKLGMCYYNLAKRSDALTHFQRAVQLYNVQKSNGIDVAAADSGIDRCRLYISALMER